MTRQPEIGSALGLTTAEVVAACDARLTHLRGLRSYLYSELAAAQEALLAGTPPIDITQRLCASTERMLTRPIVPVTMDPGDMAAAG